MGTLRSCSPRGSGVRTALEPALAHSDVLTSIGETPLVRLHRLPDPGGADVYLKLEGMNPSGSVKDRSALGMVEAAERSGELGAGVAIIESSSGNLGVALAQIGAVRGYRVIIVADRKASPGQLALMRAFGASIEMVTGDPPGGLQRARWHRVRELASEHAPAFVPDQYANPMNTRAHEEGTGPELAAALGNRLTWVISGVSTGGHLSGVAHHLRPLGVRIGAVDVDGSPLFQPAGKPYITNGIGLTWIPQNLDPSAIDQVFIASDICAFEGARALARYEGLLVGPSSGASAVAAIKIAADLSPDHAIVAIAPDRGDRYADTLLDDRWCRAHGIRPDVGPREVRRRRDIESLTRPAWELHQATLRTAEG